MKQRDRYRKLNGIWTAFLVAVLLPAAGHLIEGESALSKTANAGDGRQAPAHTVPPARDPQLAVQEEYQLARRRGTTEALELFIARHPDSPLAEQARADLAAMRR